MNHTASRTLADTANWREQRDAPPAPNRRCPGTPDGRGAMVAPRYISSAPTLPHPIGDPGRGHTLDRAAVRGVWFTPDTFGRYSCDRTQVVCQVCRGAAPCCCSRSRFIAGCLHPRGEIGTSAVCLQVEHGTVRALACHLAPGLETLAEDIGPTRNLAREQTTRGLGGS